MSDVINWPRKWISKEEAKKMFPDEKEIITLEDEMDDLRELNKLYEKIIRMLLDAMHDRDMTIWPREMIDKEATKKII